MILKKERSKATTHSTGRMVQTSSITVFRVLWDQSLISQSSVSVVQFRIRLAVNLLKQKLMLLKLRFTHLTNTTRNSIRFGILTKSESASLRRLVIVCSKSSMVLLKQFFHCLTKFLVQQKQLRV